MKKEKYDLVDLLKLFAPGTSIRASLEDLMRARMGALIVVNKGSLLSIVEGGFKVNSKFSQQKLVELAKMDGAIILSEDMKRILYANTLLSPDIYYYTKETGTRHKAAERTAKQMKTIVIAVSERKNKITLYRGNLRYELEESSEILRRATETLQILEKQKEILDDSLANLNLLEISGFSTISAVCEVLQRFEMVRRVSEIVKRYLIELGKEGIIVSMRLKELIKNLGKERELVLQDYFSLKSFEMDDALKSLNFDFLLEIANLSKTFFGEIHDKKITLKGLRFLSRTNLSEQNFSLILNNFNNLNGLLKADRETLLKILKDEEIVDSFEKDLCNLKKKIIEGKKI